MHKKFWILLLGLFLLTGCWDNIEIEDRAHVSAIGIDKHIDNTDDEEQTGKYKFTFAFPEHKKEQPKDIVVSADGDTLYNTSKIMATRSDKEFFLGHLRTVVVSIDIAKDPELFRQILDGIENHELLSRRVVLAMTEGSAEEVIKVVPDMQHMLGEFVAELFRRRDRIPRTVGGSIGGILKDLHENKNTIIPKIDPGKSDVKVAGAAIIGNYEFKGWLNERDTAHLEILKGESKTLSGTTFDYKGHIIPIELKPKKPKFKLIKGEDKDDIKILITVKMEGDIRQTYFEPKENMLDTKFIDELEKVVTSTLEERFSDAVYAVQKEFKTDVLGVDTYLRQYNHKFWREVEDDWENIFPNIQIEVRASVKLRRIGLVK